MRVVRFKRRKNYKKYIYLGLYLLVAMSLLSTHSVATIYAKYKSSSTTLETARVAKFGVIELYEYTVDGNKLINGTTAQIENVDVLDGNDVTKNLSLTYSGSEVRSYIYFVVNTSTWKLYEKENVNKIVIENENKDHLMYIEIDSSWEYIESISDEDNYIFYKTIEPNIAHNEQIIDSIHVNSISMGDSKYISSLDTSISFSVHAVSGVNITPEEAWNNKK